MIPCNQVNWENENNKSLVHQGVGISLDSNFSNIMWVAVPGRNLLHFGNIKKNYPINHTSIQKLLSTINKYRVFENVKMTESTVLQSVSTDFRNISLNNDLQVKFPSSKYADRAADFSIGTNVAVAWGRDLRCIKIPFTQNKLQAVASFLNKKNDYYYQDGNSYVWDEIFNNCTHLSKQIAHVLGLSENTLTDLSWYQQVTDNLAIPLNFLWELVNNTIRTGNNHGVKIVKIPVHNNFNHMFIAEDLKVAKTLTFWQSAALKYYFSRPEYTTY